MYEQLWFPIPYLAHNDQPIARERWSFVGEIQSHKPPLHLVFDRYFVVNPIPAMS